MLSVASATGSSVAAPDEFVARRWWMRQIKSVRRWPALLAVSFAICVIALTSSSSGTANAQDDETLVVVAVEVDPYVIREGDVPGGFLFEVWEQVAIRLGLEFEVQWIESLDDVGDVVEGGQADIVVAPLSSTTQRETSADFTSAVVASGPGFGVHQRTDNPVTLVSALFSKDILRLLGWSALGLLTLGHLMWLVDRRNPESDFNESYVRGVWDGVWWATVTVTTVGYGDTAPKTSGGRVVAIVAMVGSLFLMGAFVSEVVTALQSGRAEQIVDSIDDLDAQSVAVVEGSTLETYLVERDVETLTYTTQEDAFVAVDAGEADMVLADLYSIEANGSDYGIRAPGDVLYDEFIGFVIPEDSPLREDINGVLADLHEEGIVQSIVDRWTE